MSIASFKRRNGLETFADIVRHKREKSDLGLRAAARGIGINHSTLLRIERGELPDLLSFALVCHSYQLDSAHMLSLVANGVLEKRYGKGR